MVRAVLEGRKTQTRLILKPERGNKLVNLRDAENRPDLYSGEFDDPASWGYQFYDDGAPADLASWANLLCPFGSPRQFLWVREAWAEFGDSTIAYAATNTYRPFGSGPELPLKAPPPRWRPSIHMPRWASRLLLEVTAVRVERLRRISDADCIAEGAHGGHNCIPGYGYSATPYEHFHHLWESIHGAASWKANPWVWVIEFRVAAEADPNG